MTRTFPTNGPVDLFMTCAIHRRTSKDPTMLLRRNEMWRSSRTPDGPGTLHVSVRDGRAEAEAWGPGAGWLLDRAPDLVGASTPRPSMEFTHPVLRELRKRLPGLRLGRSARVMEALVPAIIEQKVTSFEAHRSFRRMVWSVGEPAPGPLPLRVFPDPALLAALPYDRFHRFGIERKRADTIRRVCFYAAKLERLVDREPLVMHRVLPTFAGVGPWTSAETSVRALGDPDAVSVGDLHLPHLVSWVLQGKARSSDEEMLQLLEPYRGHRALVIRLIEVGAKPPPRRAPRYEGRDIARL